MRVAPRLIQTPLEQDRRQLALNTVRILNTAQSRHVAQFGRYAPFAELATSPAMLRFRDTAGLFGDTFRWMSLQPGTDLIPGFSLQLLTDGQSYIVAVGPVRPMPFCLHE